MKENKQQNRQKTKGQLLGQHQNRLDPKSRCFLPAVFRKIIGSNLVLTRGYEGCLLIVSQNSWENLTADIIQKPFVFGPSRETARFLLGNASPIALDSQGRLLIPPYLQKFAGLSPSQDVIFLGLGRYVELWEKSTWEKYQKNLSEKINDISERLVS